MNRLFRILSLSMLLLFFAALFAPVAAQDIGSGAPIIEPNFGDDPTTFNPIIANDGTSYDVINQMLPDFIGVDSETVQYLGGAKGALVSSWDIAEDGVTYTFHLRDDMVWSDGVPITASDVAWFLDAVLSGETTSPRQQLIDNVASHEVVDDYTLNIVFNEANCTLIDTLSPVYPVPAHIYEEVYGNDYAGMDENDYNLNPEVTGGNVFCLLQLPSRGTNHPARQCRFHRSRNGRCDPARLGLQGCHRPGCADGTILRGRIDLCGQRAASQSR